MMLSYFMKRNPGAGKTPQENSQYLDKYSIYTTLEPCAQCAGMMTFLRVERVVYGQEDSSYGKALERLQLDSSHAFAPPAHGYPPYPRRVMCEASSSDFRVQLETAFSNYRSRHRARSTLTDFLYTDEAKAVFQKASEALQRLEAKYPENVAVCQAARRFLETEVPKGEPPLELHF
jgi:tRNA(Arg) A34 adenosine deaminase TadA